MLDKKAILESKDLPSEVVDVPEWGGQVTVCSLNGTQRDNFEQSLLKGKKVDMQNMRAKLCALCIVDEKGKRLFSDLDAMTLGKKSAKALDRVFTVAQKLNGMGADDIEDMVKNSGRAIAADSASG